MESVFNMSVAGHYIWPMKLVENGGEYSHRHAEAYLMAIDIVVD